MRELAKLDDVTPHILHHTFDKILIDKGVDLVTVKYLIRHKRLDSTARYTKQSQKDLEVAVARLELEEIYEPGYLEIAEGIKL